MASERALDVLAYIEANKDHREFYDMPFPLDDGRWIAQVRLPTDLTKHEAKRLAAMVGAVAFDG